MFSLDTFQKDYDAHTTDLVIRERRFRFLVPDSIDRFIHPDDLLHQFPLWAKIWEASVILSQYLAGLPVQRDRRFLEIGCGLGVVGIVASAFGHRVTMTEADPHALNFCRANVHTNLLDPDLNPEITELDWNRPQPMGPFHGIIGSEVVYKETDFQPISTLFKTYLRPGGEIILAQGLRKTSIEFFRLMGESFHIRAQKQVLRTKGKEIRVLLCRMTPKAADPPPFS
jgi:predicted nicotinamide N-methyase